MFHVPDMSAAVHQEDFFLVDGKLLCRQHASRAKEMPCAKCGKSNIDDVVISALDKRWCQTCFCCSVCGDDTIIEAGFYPDDSERPSAKRSSACVWWMRFGHFQKRPHRVGLGEEMAHRALVCQRKPP